MKSNKLQQWFCQRINSFAVYLVTFITFCLLITATGAAAVETNSSITVYRDPGCRCCGGWMEHLSEHGLQPENVPTPDIESLKQTYGVPDSLSSCHTAIIDGYVIEGHVPVADIKRLITEHPDVAGIAVPGMPIGTPGMESGDEHEPFTVFSFDQQGHIDAFNRYPAG